MPTINKKLLIFAQLWKTPLFLTIGSLLLAFNLFCSAKETIKMSQVRKRIAYTFLGDRFRGLEDFIGNAPHIGYATDKNLDDNRSAMQFAQAQLVLAPTILDLNNTTHEFVIFDYTTPQAAIKKIKELKLQALKANPYGIILAGNPDTNVIYKADGNETFDKTQHRQMP